MKLLKLIPDNTNLDFMRWRNIALVLSIIATVASLTLVGVKGLNLGVDFIGGQMIRATFPTQVNVERLRSDVDRLHLDDWARAVAAAAAARVPLVLQQLATRRWTRPARPPTGTAPTPAAT